MKRFWKKVGFILAFLAAPMSCGEDPFGLTTETVSVFLRQNFPKFEFAAISAPVVSLKDTVTFNLSFSNEDQDAVDFQILPEYLEIQKVSGDASCDISKIEAKEENTASVRMIRGTYVVSANNCTGNGVIKFLIGDKFWGQFDGRIESPGDVVSDVLTVDNLGPTIEFS
ncbi:MAG: hypothetical protein HYW48_05860, partial [Deltaproteobacteria bacterium]|nr:hypothetical protein [Deltaproteobacteria bacterium]